MGLSGPHIVDERYAIYDEIASGGMATVHFGCALGAASVSRVVAIKRLHAHLAREHEFLTMFLDEARVTARIRHPNVAPTLDVVATDREIFIVMEYVHGESLSKLFSAMRARREPMPLPVAAAVVCGVLAGLHAAHEATDERGVPLQIVHRDVSPQNVIVGHDGVARMVDFGIAKAAGRLQRTATGEIKGKFGYMAPEQVNGARVTRATDIYAAGVVLWETLTGACLFRADSDVQLAAQVLLGQIAPPSHHVQGVPVVFDDIVMCALDRDPARRFATARDMARAIETSLPVATASEVAAWVDGLVGPVLRRREQRLAEIERDWAVRTGAPDRRQIDGRPQDAYRDASTRAVSYAAGVSDGTRIEGPRRGRRDTAGLSDSQSREDAANLASSRRPRPQGPSLLWVGIALAAAASLAGAALVDRRDDVHGWLVRATEQTPSPSNAASSPIGTAAKAVPPATALGAAPATTVVTTAPSAPVVTVPVENLPIAAPPSIPIEALPRAVDPAPTSMPSARPASSRPKTHR
jgi:serine/threonine-protein kinase